MKHLSGIFTFHNQNAIQFRVIFTVTDIDFAAHGVFIVGSLITSPQREHALAYCPSEDVRLRSELV
jgi:hypothetical protein